jgi:hypothetical protein
MKRWVTELTLPPSAERGNRREGEAHYGLGDAALN